MSLRCSRSTLTTGALEALKADLIEYEEKYERCKSENASTAKQLDVLTTEFDRLKFGFEAARSATSAADAKLAVS